MDLSVSIADSKWIYGMTADEITTTYRPTLLSIAYRMTGEVMISEDIVQDVLLNWMIRSVETVQDTKAYLAKSVVNASLNYLDRVKRQREAYKGMWLPEPILTGGQHTVDAKVDISYGFMLLLEKLSPMERAVFVLKESFDIAYSELAQLFDTNEANTRQLYRRANEKISGPNRRYPIDSQQQRNLIAAFAQASETGNIDGLIQLLKSDVVLYSDGGGKAATALKPLFGPTIIGQFLQSLSSKFGSLFTLTPTLVNGNVALLFREIATQQLNTIMILDMDEMGIHQIFSLRNPDKLAHFQ